MMNMVVESTHSQGLVLWAPRAARRGIKLSPVEVTMKKAQKRSERPVRCELGVRRMKVAAVCLDKTRGGGEEEVRM